MQARLWNFDEPLTDREVLGAFCDVQPMSRRQVARQLNRSKSPTLVTRLNNLAAQGYLSIQFVRLPNGVDMWTYQLTDEGDHHYRKLVEEHDRLFFAAEGA